MSDSLPTREALIERWRQWVVSVGPQSHGLWGSGDIADFALSLLRERAPEAEALERAADLCEDVGLWLNGREVAPELRALARRRQAQDDRALADYAGDDTAPPAQAEPTQIPGPSPFDSPTPAARQPEPDVFERVALEVAFAWMHGTNERELAALLRERFGPCVAILEKVLALPDVSLGADVRVHARAALAALSSGQEGRTC